MNVGMQDIGTFISASKGVLDIFKTMAGLLPKGQDPEVLQKRLAEAEAALRASEVQLAKALGYHLCQCTFPPQIMLSKGRRGVYEEEVFKCEKCEKQTPSEHHFELMEKAANTVPDNPFARI